MDAKAGRHILIQHIKDSGHCCNFRHIVTKYLSITKEMTDDFGWKNMANNNLTSESRLKVPRRVKNQHCVPPDMIQ